MRILIDLDGVGADWTGGVERAIGTRSGPLGKWLDWTRWDGINPDAPEAQGRSLERIIREEVARPGFYASLLPIDGFVDAVRALADAGHDVWFVSTPDSTNPTCASDKIAWVEQHVGEGWGKRVILTHDKTLVRGDILIDDKPEILNADGEPGDPEWVHVLYDAPYNRGLVSHLGRPVIRDWSDPQRRLLPVLESFLPWRAFA